MLSQAVPDKYRIVVHTSGTTGGGLHFVTTKEAIQEKWGGSILKKLTPFDGMSHDNYIKWFKKNRVKRRGLPVYKDYHDESINRMKDIFVKSRQRGIELLLRLQLKRGLKR